MTTAIPVDITWSAALPLPVREFEGQTRNTTIGPSNEAQKVTQRSRYSKAYYILGVSWIFTLSEHETFKFFFDETLYNGAAAFEMDLRYPLISQLNAWVVKFTGGYKATYLDGNWRVDAEIELVHQQGEDTLPAPEEGYEYLYVLSETPGAPDEPLTTDEGVPITVRIS